MRNDGKAEIQHYVPRVLLRLHVNDPLAKKGSEQVWCFDKRTDKVFSPNIKGILAGARFYEIEVNGETVSFEEPLTAIEDQVAPILERLTSTRILGEISTSERKAVASFCAVQFLRTQAFRDQVKDLNQVMADALQKRGIVPSEVSNFKMLSDEEIKTLSLAMLNEAPATYGPHFLDKHWYLVEGKTQDPFHLGDQPVVLDNDFAPAGRGVGIASPGVSIYLPLCPTLCLSMTDPLAVSQIFRDGLRVDDNYKKIEKSVPRKGFEAEAIAALGQMNELRDKVNKHIDALKGGTPTPYDHRAVTRINSLQMLNASRWIISSQPDFSLPKIMIRDDEKMRKRRGISLVD
jgi:hypothetical protein